MLDSDDFTTDTTSAASGATPAAGQGSAEQAAKAAPRKRAPRKAAAKKVATQQDDGTAAGAAPTDGAAAGSATPDAEAPVRTPRKRAAKKAAPAAEAPSTDAPSTDTAGTDAPSTDAPARAPRKRAAKKAAPAAQAPDTDATVAPDGSSADATTDTSGGTEPTRPARAPRKRTPRKAAPAADQADSTPAEDDAAAQAAPGVLFIAPTETAAEKPTRRRPAKRTAPAVEALTDEALADEDPVGTADEDPTDGDETADPEDVREAAIEQASGARRRRRRGRRGRGGARADTEDGGDTDSGDDDTDDDTAAQSTTDAETDSEDDDTEGQSASSRRRRRRRRSDSGGGNGEDGTPDDPPNTVTHVRDGGKKGRSGGAGGNSHDDGDDGVRGVKGSTRLEAKRQRRRDGRETSRRRAPILTESEFLARREAVDRVMAVRQHGDRTQIAVLEDDILVEHYVTRASATSYVGNVYLGRVQNVLPSMEAAFIDIGKGRNGVLYAGEVNWDAAGLEGKSRAIENAMKSGDPVLVQVTKDPIGHKGARLTSQVSLPGRFLVLVPGGGMTGISRRLPDTERHRLKSILKKIVPEDAGVIVRTAAEGASEEDLTRDVERLSSQWEQIKSKSAATSSAPTLVHGEPDIAIRVVRDVFNEDFKKLVVQGDDVWSTVSEYLGGVAPDLAERTSKHVGTSDLFNDLRVDEQLAKALDRKVWLPSGGSLVIDRTEAMTVVDVNTGKYVGSGGNLEQTVTRNNLEAAEEIVRQLRLRDVGGIVVIDFIDMVLESNRDLVLRRLTECLGRDRTKHQVAEVTSLGLVQMTRKRVGEGLLEAFSDTCDHCHGRGLIVHSEPVDKPSGATPDVEDDRPQGGAKGKRRRGGRGGQAAAPAAEVETAPVLPEQREAAVAAIAAIHRAAEGGKPETGNELVDELASGLFAAALGAEGTPPEGRSENEVRDSAPVETGTAVGTVTTTPPSAEAVAEWAPSTDPVTPSGRKPAAATPAAGDKPATGRRRRVATRPATAPTAAEPAVVVVDPAESSAPEAATPAPATTSSAPATATQPAGESSEQLVTEVAAAPPVRRRRRAASRPAGPPTS